MLFKKIRTEISRIFASLKEMNERIEELERRNDKLLARLDALDASHYLDGLRKERV